MPSPSVLTEIDAIVFDGDFSSRTGERVEIHDRFFRNIVGLWTGPSIDALYFALESLYALTSRTIADSAATSLLGDLVSPAKVEQYVSFVEELRDPRSGGFFTSRRANKPNLYAAAIAHATLADLLFPETPDANARRDRLNLAELRNRFPGWADDYVGFVTRCELPYGGFSEHESVEPGTITTDRGIRLLAHLGVPVSYGLAHERFLAECWIIPDQESEGRLSSCRSAPGDDRSWIAPLRYNLAALARSLTSSSADEVLARLEPFSAQIAEFVTGARVADRGWGFAPGQPESIVATWDVVRLHSAAERIVQRFPNALDTMRPILNTSVLGAKNLISLLRDHIDDGVGWVAGSNSNLCAIAAASRCLATLADERVGSSIVPLAQQLSAAVLSHRVGPDFRCYRV